MTRWKWQSLVGLVVVALVTGLAAFAVRRADGGSSAPRESGSSPTPLFSPAPVPSSTSDASQPTPSSAAAATTSPVASRPTHSSSARTTPTAGSTQIRYSVEYSPAPGVAGQEVAIAVSNDPEYGYPGITFVDFGDGTTTSCSYTSPSHGTSDDCNGFGEEGEEICYHVYAAPGHYRVRVEGRPGLSETNTAVGSITVEVVARPTPSGSGLLPDPSPSPPHNPQC